MTRRFAEAWRALPPGFRKAIAGLLGGSVVGIGAIMLVTPGPAIVVIPIGLSILAAEFAWVRHLVRKWVPETWQPEFVRDDETSDRDRPGAHTSATETQLERSRAAAETRA